MQKVSSSKNNSNCKKNFAYIFYDFLKMIRNMNLSHIFFFSYTFFPT